MSECKKSYFDNCTMLLPTTNSHVSYIAIFILSSDKVMGPLPS